MPIDRGVSLLARCTAPAARLALRGTLALSLLIALGAALSAGSGTGASKRHFAMGFTPFPHDGGATGVFDALKMIDVDGDLTVFHFDDGIPWNDALAGKPHPDRATLTYLRSLSPAGNRVYLAVTPIALSRDALAPDYPNVPLAPPWDGYAFDDPAVVTAFTNHCEEMLSIFVPDWFSIGIEANLVHTLAPAKWNAWLSLQAQVYSALKTTHPGLPIFATLQADEFWFRIADPPSPITGLTQTQAIVAQLQWCDAVVVSSYPIANTWFGHVSELPAGYLDAVRRLAPGKPFAVGETGWPGETLDAPYPRTLRTNAMEQREWVECVLATAARHDALFVNWYLTWDYDDLWSSGLIAQDALNRTFRDMGLRDGVGRERPGLRAWRDWLAR